MLNKARKLNIQIKTIVLKVIKNSVAWNQNYLQQSVAGRIFFF
jgi:hypothetical protein